MNKDYHDYDRAPTPAPNSEQVRIWAEELKHGHNGCLEVRSIGKRQGRFEDRQTSVGFFDSIDALTKVTLEHHGRKAVYVGLNPRNAALLHTQPANTLVAGAEGGKADDVLYRQWLPIDTDSIRASRNVAATEEELNAASIVAEAVQAFFKEKGVPFARANSGNGYHQLTRTVKYPAGKFDAKTDPISILLRWFHRQFSASAAQVDVGVADPARVWKVYGTASVKGGNTLLRPWRTAKLLDPIDTAETDVVRVFEVEIKDQEKFERLSFSRSAQSKGGRSWRPERLTESAKVDLLSLFKKGGTHD